MQMCILGLDMPLQDGCAHEMLDAAGGRVVSLCIDVDSLLHLDDGLFDVADE